MFFPLSVFNNNILFIVVDFSTVIPHFATQLGNPTVRLICLTTIMGKVLNHNVKHIERSLTGSLYANFAVIKIAS